MILLTAAAVLLYPVAADDQRLLEDGTIVSQDARTAMQSDAATILCMDLPEDASSHRRACLTRDEWRHTLALAAQDAAQRESVLARERARTNAEIYLR